MKLSRILKEVKINSIYRTGGKTIKKGGFRENSNYDPDISSLHYRAQDVQPGGLFNQWLSLEFLRGRRCQRRTKPRHGTGIPGCLPAGRVVDVQNGVPPEAINN